METAEYIRKPGDVKFRRISLTYAGRLPDFEEFTGEGQKVNYNESQVLEIIDSDGRTHMEYGYSKKIVTTSKLKITEGIKIRITADIPTEHLWIKAEDANYKIPSKLPVDAGFQYLILPTLAGGVKVEGDEYFKAAFKVM